MKVESIANFMMENKVRGIMFERKIGEKFEIDETDPAEAELIYTLWGGRRIKVIDEKFVPKSWRYHVRFQFNYLNEAGERRTALGGKEVTLDQKTASEFLISGHIVPVDKDGWRPTDLLKATVNSAAAKAMFDEEPAPKDSWVAPEGGGRKWK